MPRESTMADAGVLREQYSQSDRHAARQALWRMRTGPALYSTVLDLAALEGTESVVDVGCGNGTYLAELRRRGHRGPVIGLDLSAGMAAHSAAYAPTARADVQALPLGDSSVDIVLSMHMLYHVPNLTLAVAELRRVLRPGGTALVTTNSTGHMVEIKQFLAMAAQRVTGTEGNPYWSTRRFDEETGMDLLTTAFDDVELQQLGGQFPIDDPTILRNYIESMPPESVGLRTGPLWTQVLATAGQLVAEHFAANQHFQVTSQVALFRCR